jgi:hypothetical protein
MVRMVVATCVVTLLVASAVFMVPQFHYLWRQRACMEFTPPANTVAFDGEPHAASELLRDSQYRPCYFRFPQNLPAGVRSPRAYFVPELYSTLGWSYRSPPVAHAVVFLHERQSARRLSRLATVIGAVNDDHGSKGQAVVLHAWALTPASFVPGSRLGTPPRPVTTQISSGANQALRMFFAQPDPVDLARFTIRYQIDGNDGWIDGRLCDPEPWVYAEDTPLTCERIELTIRSDSPAERVRDRPWLSKART